jgi:hypothetical protein
MERAMGLYAEQHPGFVIDGARVSRERVTAIGLRPRGGEARPNRVGICRRDIIRGRARCLECVVVTGRPAG